MARRRARKRPKPHEEPEPTAESSEAGVAEPQPANKSRGSTAFWLLGLIVIAGVGLRLASIFGELWFDELWTVQLIEEKLAYVWDVFWVNHDNNHILNTVYVFFVGSDQPFWSYRIHSVLAGLASILLAYQLLRPVGQSEGLVGAALMAVSYPMVLYGSESRGYGLFVMFSLASVLGLERFLRHRTWRWAIFCAVCSLMGVFAHLTFFFVAGAMFVRCLAGPLAWVRRTGPANGPPETWRGLLTALPLAGWPLAVIAGVRIFVFPSFILGGSDKHRSYAAAWDALSVMSGGSDSGWLTVVPVLSSILLIGYGLWRLAQQDRIRMLFFASLIGQPLALFLWRNPKSVYLRTMLAPYTFLLLLCGISAVALWRRGGWQRALVGLWLALFCLGNAQSLGVLLTDGRAQYAPALEMMARESPGAAIRIASDNDFRHGHLLSFHNRYLPEGKQLSYFSADRWPQPSPQWYLTHSIARLRVPPDSVTVLGNLYRLRMNCQPPPLSGWTHFVYELERPAPRRE